MTLLPRSFCVFAALSCCGAIAVQAAPPSSRRTMRSVPPSSVRKPAAKPAPAKPSPTKPAAKVAPSPSDAPPTTKPTPPQPLRETDQTKTPAAKTAPAAPLAEPTPAVVQSRTTELFAPPPVAAATDRNGKYVFRYQFAKGETVRWLVEHRAKIASTVQGSSQTAETTTVSVKAWKVLETFPGGETKFINSVDSIDMRQKHTGRQETRYNSRTDADVPPIFETAAKQVGRPLAEVTIDARGNVQKRIDLKKAAEGGEPEETAATDITIVLPDAPLAVGESWTAPLEMWAASEKGVRLPIKARRKVTLESVTGNLAVLRHETQILSPLTDPSIEAQVVQSEQAGHVTFDLSRGRIIKLSLTNDREVFGFQGDASMMHVEASFVERLADAEGEPLPEAADAATPVRATSAAPAASSGPIVAPAVRPATDDDKTAERPTAKKAK